MYEYFKDLNCLFEGLLESRDVINNLDLSSLKTAFPFFPSHQCLGQLGFCWSQLSLPRFSEIWLCAHRSALHVPQSSSADSRNTRRVRNKHTWRLLKSQLQIGILPTLLGREGYMTKPSISGEGRSTLPIPVVGNRKVFSQGYAL